MTLGHINGQYKLVTPLLSCSHPTDQEVPGDKCHHHGEDVLPEVSVQLGGVPHRCDGQVTILASHWSIILILSSHWSVLRSPRAGRSSLLCTKQAKKSEKQKNVLRIFLEFDFRLWKTATNMRQINSWFFWASYIREVNDEIVFSKLSVKDILGRPKWKDGCRERASGRLQASNRRGLYLQRHSYRICGWKVRTYI